MTDRKFFIVPTKYLGSATVDGCVSEELFAAMKEKCPEIIDDACLRLEIEPTQTETKESV